MTEPPDAENFSSDAVRSVTALTLVSRVLGLARDVAMAAVFGGGPVFDAFTLAFRVPNLFRRWFGEGAFSLAVIPALTRVASRQGPAARDRLATALVLFASGVTALIAVVTFCGLTGLVGSGVFAAGRDRLWADYVRILIWYLPLICATAQLSAVLQTAGRFAAAAFVPVVLNLSWLATLAVWLGLAGSRGESATLGGALCCAIVVSGLLQLAVVSGDCFRSRVWIRLPGRTDWGRARRIVAGAPAAVAAVGITQVNVVVDAIFAWWAAPVGAVSALYFGQRLYEFPIGVFALAVGAVIFPAMASREADGDRPGLGRTTADGLRLVAFLGMPAAVGLVLVARPLVTLFFRYGAFSDADAGRTAAVVVALAVGVLPGMLLPILQRAHLAVGATGRCVRFPVIAVVANAVLDGPAAWLAGEAGLAAVTSAVAWLLAVLMWRGLPRSGVPVGGGSLVGPLVRMAIGSAVMAVAVFVSTRFLPGDGSAGWARVVAVAVPVGIGAAIYLGVTYLIGLRDGLRLLGRGPV